MYLPCVKPVLLLLCCADVHLPGLEEAPQQLQIRAPHEHHPRVSGGAAACALAAAAATAKYFGVCAVVSEHSAANACFLHLSGRPHVVCLVRYGAWYQLESCAANEHGYVLVSACVTNSFPPMLVLSLLSAPACRSRIVRGLLRPVLVITLAAAGEGRCQSNAQTSNSVQGCQRYSFFSTPQQNASLTCVAGATAIMAQAALDMQAPYQQAPSVACECCQLSSNVLPFQEVTCCAVLEWSNHK
jgi:hypothetical protein